MEVNNVPNVTTPKTDKTPKAAPPRKAQVAAYSQTAAASDQVQVSDKAKLLLSLRDSYKKMDLPLSPDRMKAIQDKIEAGKNLNPEEIVTGILRGTLYDVI